MDKITVRRANVVLDVNAIDKAYYMAQGFSVVDASGKVVEEAIPTDVGALKVQVGELTKKLAAANATIAELNATIEELKSAEKPKGKGKSKE